jgi:hypothetical protein
MQLNSSSDAVLFPLRLQSQLDQALTAANPVAHREPTAALFHGTDSLLQSHSFVFNPSSTSGFSQRVIVKSANQAGFLLTA